MNFERELKREFEDQKKSLNFYFLNDIEKSVITELSYQSDFNIINKKGSEIKEKILIHKGIAVKSISDCVSKMQEISNSLNIQPEEKCDNGIFRYSYSQIYPTDNYQSDSQNLMREYNDKSWRLIEFKKDLESSRLILDNIKEDKNYKLPIYIATQLGF